MNILDIGLLGLDFGSFKSVISLCKKGSLEIVLNESSSRETRNIVAFTERETLMGDQAYMKLKSNYKNTIIFPQRYLNQCLIYDKNLFENEEKAETATLRLNDQGNALVFDINYQKKNCLLAPIQVISILFGFYEKMIKKSRKIYGELGFVISIPSDFTPEERVLLNKSVAICSMNCLKLLNESTAIGLIYKNLHEEEIQTSPQGKRILFIDVGYSKVGVYLINFLNENITIVSEIYDRYLGVRDIDQFLYVFYQGIIAKDCPNYQESMKTKLRLLESIEKQRKVLSANTESPLTVESLTGDYDLSYTLTRQEYEKIILPFTDKLKNLFLKFKLEGELFNKNLLFDDIEIIGGGTRIPIVQKTISDAFETISLSKTLNATECFSMGAALYCAKTAGAPLNFNIGLVHEIMYYTIYYSVRNFNNSEIIVFNKGASFPCSANVVIPYEKSIDYVDFYYKIAEKKYVLYELKIEKKGEIPENSIITISAAINDDGILIIKDMKINEKSQKLVFQKDLFSLVTDQELKAYSTQYHEMDKQNKLIQESYEIKNRMEAYIYTKRSELLEKYKPQLTELLFQEIKKIFEESEHWLYNHDDSQSEKNIYESKFNSLQEKIEPIYEECREEFEMKKLKAQEITSFDQLKTFLSEHKQGCIECVNLNFSGQKIGNGGGIFGYFQKGIKKIRNILANVNIIETLRLDMRNNAFSDEAMDCLIEIFQKQNKVITLDLQLHNDSKDGENVFSQQAVYKLCDFVKNLQKIKRFKLSLDSIDEYNFKILSLNLEMKSTIERIEIKITKDAKISQEARKSFSQIKKINKSVKVCKLEINE